MASGPTTWAIALLAWIIIGSVPGLLVATAARPASALLDRWAVAPAVSIGIASVVGSYAERLHAGIGLRAAAAALAGASLVAVVVIVRRRVGGRLRPAVWRRGHTALISLVTLSLALDALLIARSWASWNAVVPRVDGIAHGVLVQRIVTTGSLDPSTVFVTDIVSGSGGIYYPLGLHTLAAMVGVITGTPVAITSAGFVAASVWAPLAIAAWARRAAGTTIAVVAAGVLALATPAFAFMQGFLGFWPLIAAVALVPAVALAVLDAAPGFGALVPVAAVAGLAMVHTTEPVVAAILVGATALLGGAPRLRRLVAPALVFVVGVLVVVPLALGALGGRGQDIADAVHVPAGLATTELLLLPALGQLDATGDPVSSLVGVVWWVLAAAGSVLLWRRAQARGTVATVWLFALLSWCSLVGIAHLVTIPWYDVGTRLLGQCAALACIPLAAAAVAAVRTARTPRSGVPGHCGRGSGRGRVLRARARRGRRPVRRPPADRRRGGRR